MMSHSQALCERQLDHVASGLELSSGPAFGYRVVRSALGGCIRSTRSRWEGL